MTDNVRGDQPDPSWWKRLDESPPASAQMLVWHAPETVAAVERWLTEGDADDSGAETLRRRIGAIHHPVTETDLICSDDDCEPCYTDGRGHTREVCAHCRGVGSEDGSLWTFLYWPCPTIRILASPGRAALSEGDLR